MKLLSFTKFFPFLHQNLHQNSSVLSTSLFSTKIPAHYLLSNCSPSSLRFLFDRISIIRDPKVSVLPVIGQWVNEGGTAEKSEFQHLVRTMRGFRRYKHALEISQYMTDRWYFELSPTDVAVRLDLIHRVHGIEHAEIFFNNVSNKVKTYKVYGALLSSYMREKSVEKAEHVMEKMREMGMAKSSYPYNVLMNLYTATGDYDKIDILVQEMEMNGIPQDKYTMRNRMAAAVAASDISEMERILNQIEDNSNLVVEWVDCSIAASGYLNVGMTEKALLMLKKMESMMPLQRRKQAFEFLISLYAKTNNKDELYRVWNTYKPSDTRVDTSYCNMITALAKLDDLDGAEKVFGEWESQCTIYDFRVLNRLLVFYCKKGLLDKAESVVNKAVEGRTPYASTWNILALGFMEHNQMPKAVEMLKKAISVGRRGWRPSSKVLAACLDYLEEQGDGREMEEMIRSLKNSGFLTVDLYHRLLRCRIRAGETVSEIVDQMKMDGFDDEEETHEILESLSSL